MAGCRRAREEQPCGPCRGALAFGFSHPGAASAPACPQTRFFGRIASHGATATAPPPDIVVASLWLAACCCLVSERDRSLVCLAPASHGPSAFGRKQTDAGMDARNKGMGTSAKGANAPEPDRRRRCRCRRAWFVGGARRQAEAGGD